MRDVRDLQLARGTSDLHFMDIAATVNPATVHFRSLTEPSRVSVLEQNYEYDLLEPDKLLRKYVGRDVTLVRRAADRRRDARGRREGAPPQLQQRAGVADRRRDRHRHAGRSHRFPELPGNLYSRPTLIWTLDNSGGARAPGRSVVPGRQAVMERGLRADGRARRQDRRHRRLGDGGQRQRHVVQARDAAAGRGRSEPRPSGHRPHGGRVDAEGHGRRRAARWRRRRSPTTTSTRSAARRRSTTTRPSRSACWARTGVSRPEALRRRRAGRSTTATRSIRARRSRTSCRCTTSSRTRRRRARHADAGRHGARLSGGLEGRHAVRRRGSHRSHAEGRSDQPEDRQRVRRRRASASRPTSRGSRATCTRSRTRSRCATTRRRRSRSR